MTSLLLITFVLLSITSDKVEGRKGEVEKVRKGQSLGEAQTGKGGPEKEKLKLKKRKQKRRKTMSKKEKKGKSEQNIKRGNKKHRKGKRKNTENKKHSKDRKKNKKTKKKNANRKLKTEKKKLKMKESSDNKDSIKKEVARQIGNATTKPDPDRYNHCDYLDLVEVGYRQDSECKPGDKMVFKVGNFKFKMPRLKHTHCREGREFDGSS